MWNYKPHFNSLTVHSCAIHFEANLTPHVHPLLGKLPSLKRSDYVDVYFSVVSIYYQTTAHSNGGARTTLRGYALWSLVAMAFGNQCKPFSIVTPTRANSEGKLQGQKFWSKFSKIIFDQFSRHFMQLRVTLVFSHFWQYFCCLDPQKSHFLTFGNDHTVIVQYLLVIPNSTTYL